jgi:hypothetical protein
MQRAGGADAWCKLYRGYQFPRLNRRHAMSKKLTCLISGAAAAAALTLSPGAQAQQFFTATMTGAQEAPVPGSPTASGFATFVLNEALSALQFEATVFGLDFTGTQTPDPGDNLTNAHIHAPAPPGVAAGVVFGFIGMPFNDNNPNDAVVTPFTTGVGGTVSAKWDAAEGNNTTLSAQLPAILAGNSYINFHTAQFPGGAIRGQIIVAPIPEPMTLSLMAAGLLAAGGMARTRRKAQPR